MVQQRLPIGEIAQTSIRVDNRLKIQFPEQRDDQFPAGNPVCQLLCVEQL
jgi:hypothetical protein